MKIKIPFAVLGLAALLATSSFAADGVEVLAKGPVHEGYAEPSEREPVATAVVPKEPPKPIEELPPDQKPEGENVQWMPGYWAWDEEKKDFLWISGFWRNLPPGRTWVQGSWRKAADGWQWSGGFWAEPKKGDEKKANIEYLPQPPAPLDEKGPTTPAPAENQIYVPGTWVYRDRYVWRPGFWHEYRANWVWVPAHYRWSPAGYVFIDGYWDYPLATRGILFAPAYISPAVYLAPAYVYTPTIVVREECLFGAFFHRRGYGCYYFGDYFAPRYASIGFVAWSGHVSASITIGAWRDPLFAHYHCGFRSDPYWRAGVFDLYAGRYRGDYMRPPVTLVQQTTIINNIHKNTTVNTNNVAMLTPLKEAGAGGHLALQHVPESERLTQQQRARTLRESGERRGAFETTLARTPGAGLRGGAPRTGTLDVVASPTRSRTPISSKDSGTSTGRPAASGSTSKPIGKSSGSGLVIPKHEPATLTSPDRNGKPTTGTRSGTLRKDPRFLDDPKSEKGLPKSESEHSKPAPKSGSPKSKERGKSEGGSRGRNSVSAPLNYQSGAAAKPTIRAAQLARVPSAISKPPALLRSQSVARATGRGVVTPATKYKAATAKSKAATAK